MNPQMTPILPLEQATFSFAGYEFLIVRLPNGSVAVIFRHLCEALDLDRRSQTRRIQANSVLAKHLVLVRIETPGGPQVVNALMVSVLSLWLGGFRLGRLSEEKQALIKLLQTDAADAFNSHFYKAASQPAPPKPGPATPSLPPPPASQTPLPSLPEMFQALGTHVGQEIQRLEAQLASLGRQHQTDVAFLAEAHHHMQLQDERIEVLWSVLLGSAAASEDALSADQQHTLELLLHYHQRATGQPRAVTEREVLKLVGAAELRNLEQRDWKPILTWFRQRLGR
jgi:hypothetical protein